MQRVFVLDRNRQPLMPCRPKRARLLLKSQAATVFHRNPFWKTTQNNFKIKNKDKMNDLLQL